MKKINLTLLTVLMAFTSAFAQTGIYTGTVTATESTLGINEVIEDVSIEVKSNGSNYALVLQDLNIGGVVIPSFEMNNVVITPTSGGYTLTRQGSITVTIPELTIPEGIPIIGGQTFYNVPVAITMLEGSTIMGDVLNLNLRAVATLIPFPPISATLMIHFEGNREIPPVPVADFKASETNIMEGDNVQFTDLSTNNPTSWHWYFEGGTPAESTAQNPKIVYATAGKYDVKLVVSNANGSHELIREDYITVTPTPIDPPPVADFTANVTEIEEGDTVSFTDMSQNDPETYLWHFEGGVPQESSDKNPSVVYPTEGVYTVSLTVRNENGEDTEVKENYITVKTKTGIGQLQVTSYELQVYPNPTTGELRINNEQLIIENVQIFDIMGRMVMTVTHPQQSETIINVSALSNGVYFLRMGDKMAKFVKE